MGKNLGRKLYNKYENGEISWAEYRHELDWLLSHNINIW